MGMAACGSTPERGLSPTNAASLKQDLAEIRTASAARSPVAASAALDRFAGLVHRRAVAGDFRPAETAALRRLIAQTRARIPLDITAPPPPVQAPVSSAAPVQPAPQAEKPGSAKKDKPRKRKRGKKAKK